MDDFTGSLTATPKRAMDRNLMGNDAATLRALCGTLNNPNITGAVVPPEDKITQITAPMPLGQNQIEAAIDMHDRQVRPSSALAATVKREMDKAAQVLHAAAVKREMDKAAQVLQETPLVSATAAPLTPHQKREERAAAQKQSFVIAQALDRALQPETKPQQSSAHAPTKRLFFTGHPFSGKSWLAGQIKARVFGFADPIFSLATSAFGNIEDRLLLGGFVREVTAWGNGIVTPDYPLTAARAMFCDKVHDAGSEGDELMGIPVARFGYPGFWMASLLARVVHFQDAELAEWEKTRGKQDTEAAIDALASRKSFTPTIVAVTDIQTPEQYKTLREAGFRPYHVACHNNTRTKRGAAVNDFSRVAAMIEGDITKKLSREPQGAKLWCIWNDTENAAPSQRLLSLNEFLAAYQ